LNGDFPNGVGVFKTGFDIYYREFGMSVPREITPSILGWKNKRYVPGKDYENVLRGVGGRTIAKTFTVKNLGCTMSDFEGFVEGSISFIRYGDCAFATKLGNSIRVKASGVVIYRTTPGEKSFFVTKEESILLSQEPIYTFPIFFCRL